MMHGKIAIFAILMGLCSSELTNAETIIESSQLITPQPADLLLAGHAVYQAASNEYELTQNTTWQQGTINTKNSICAKEYVIQFDVNVGDKNANANGGAGVVFYEIDANTNHLMNVVELNIQDRARVSKYNNLEMFEYSNDTLLESLATPVTFPMGGAGFIHIRYHMNEGLATVLLNSQYGQATLSSTRNAVSGTPITHRFLGWTGTARNLQKIKNFTIEIIEADDCQPPLTDDQLTEVLVSACGDSATSCNQDCYLATMQPLVADHKITDAQMQIFLSKCSANSCEEVDLTSISNEAFAAGVASIDQKAIEESGYERGFIAGVASVDQDAIEDPVDDSVDVDGVDNADDTESDYDLGFNDGIASIDQTAIRKEGYDSGYADGLAKGQSKITICHKATKKVKDVKKVTQNTITVSIKALQAHIKHGDTIGACPKSSTDNKK